MEAFYSQARTKRKAALGDSEDSQKDVTALKQDKALLEAQVEKLREDDDAAVDAAGLRNACNGVVVIANAEESKT